MQGSLSTFVFRGLHLKKSSLEREKGIYILSSHAGPMQQDGASSDSILQLWSNKALRRPIPGENAPLAGDGHMGRHEEGEDELDVSNKSLTICTVRDRYSKRRHHVLSASSLDSESAHAL